MTVGLEGRCSIQLSYEGVAPMISTGGIGMAVVSHSTPGHGTGAKGGADLPVFGHHDADGQ